MALTKNASHTHTPTHTKVECGEKQNITKIPSLHDLSAKGTLSDFSYNFVHSHHAFNIVVDNGYLKDMHG